MPLKLIPPRKGKSPNWTIRGTYLRQYVNRSSGSPKRAIAIKALARLQDEIERGEFSERSEPTFASAVTTYLRAQGNQRTRARERESRKRLRRLVEHFGETAISKIDQAAIDAAAFGLYPNASGATRNRQVYTPVSAVLKHAGARVDIRRPAGSAGSKATAWLWPEQADAMFEEGAKLDKEFEALMITLCYTGMRLNEALNRESVWRLQDAFAYVPDSKNGDPIPVFLPPVVVSALASLPDWRGFRFTKSGHIYSLLKTAAFKAGVTLPKRSAFHIFRHTYATWMRRYGGLDTRGLLGTERWKNEKSVHRYVHVVASEEAQRAALLPVRGKSVA